MKKNLSLIFLFLSLAFFACDNPINTTAAFTITPAEAVVGSAITFDASASDGPITSFEWDFGDESYGTGQKVQHVYVMAKIFTVKLTIRDSEGKTKTSNAQVDIYREGRKLLLTKTYPGSTAESAIWIDSVFSEDSKNSKAVIAIGQDNLARSTQYLTFILSLPSDTFEYLNHKPTENFLSKGYEIILISSIPPKYLFKINDPDWQCYSTKGLILLVELQIKNFNSGSIEIESPLGRDCLQGYKFPFESWNASFQVVMEKYYD